MTFFVTGLYLYAVFSDFLLDDIHGYAAYHSFASKKLPWLFLWLSFAITGLVMMLSGLGLWRRWRYLSVLALAPFSFPVVLLLVDIFTDWYIFSWHDWLLLFLGGCVLISASAFAVRFSYRRWPQETCKPRYSFFTSPSIAIRITSALIGIGTVIYCSSYIYLSVQGCFEPEMIGLNGVKFYSWAPRGFVDKFEWNRSRMTFYQGLWELDNSFWHNSGPGYDLRRKYPVDYVSQDEISKVYRAWDPSSASRIVSPDKKYQIWIRAYREPGHAFIDRTRKPIHVTIIRNIGDNVNDLDSPQEIMLFTNQYKFECSDVWFKTSWDEKNKIAVTVYDYAPDVYQEDAQKTHIPSNFIATISFAFDKQTGKFHETKPLP